MNPSSGGFFELRISLEGQKIQISTFLFMIFWWTLAKLVQNPDFLPFFHEKSGIFLENSRAVTTGGPHGPHGGPMGPNWANVPPLGKTFFRKKYQKFWNVHFWVKNQSCSHRNSAHFGTQTVPWGPLFDHFLDFHFFAKIGVPGSIPHVCFFLGFSGAAQSFFRGKNRPFPKLNRGTLDFYHFLTIFDVFL